MNFSYAIIAWAVIAIIMCESAYAGRNGDYVSVTKVKASSCQCGDNCPCGDNCRCGTAKTAKSKAVTKTRHTRSAGSNGNAR
jgi:hypothetical protein